MAKPKKSSKIDEDLTTCVICFEFYDEEIHCPKYLCCHHTFCITCLQGIVSPGTLVKCPTCRKVTAVGVGNSLIKLRTNSHAVQLAAYKRESEKSFSLSQQHATTSLSDSVDKSVMLTADEAAMAGTQLMNTFNKLQKENVLLHNVIELVEVLKKNIGVKQQQNTAEMERIKAELQNPGECNTLNCNPEPKDLGSKLLEAAEKLHGHQISVQLENSAGSPAILVPNTKIKLDFKTPVNVGAGSLNAASQSLLSFAFLQLAKDQINETVVSQPLQQQVTAQPLPSTSQAAACAIPAASAAQKSLGAIPKQTIQPKHCFMEINCNGLLGLDPRSGDGVVVFQTTPQFSGRLCEIFYRAFNYSLRPNYSDAYFLKACPGQYVMFGEDSPVDLDDSVAGFPMIENRGDVGLYLGDTIRSALQYPELWEFVIFLSDFVPRNVRRAPLVATVVQGLELCEELSRLRARERDDISIDFIQAQ